MDRRAEILNDENQVKGGDEAERQTALAEYDICETPDEAAFDDLVSLAAQLCGTSSAAILFLDGERQWLQASLNLDDHSRACATALCARAVAHAPDINGVLGPTLPIGANFGGLGAGHFVHGMWLAG